MAYREDGDGHTGKTMRWSIPGRRRRAYREDDEVEHTGKTETGIPEMTERGRAFALTIV